MPVAEKFQDVGGVVADGSKLDALLLKSRNRILQLDQLPFAKRSPIGGAEKQENGAVRSFQRFQSL